MSVNEIFKEKPNKTEQEEIAEKNKQNSGCLFWIILMMIFAMIADLTGN